MISVKLALQGGGAHGAFTWGALDRLLELPGLAVESISGTSSGGMNAAALAQGWAHGGAPAARASLEAFWTTLAGRNAVADWWRAHSLPFADALPWPAVAPPSQGGINPLRSLVEEFFDEETLRHGPVALHVAATRMRDGALAVFSGARLSHDALLASASLPPWFPPTEIDGETYWDGGFAGNPALEPLLYAGGDEVLCILLQPLQRQAMPRTAREALMLSAEFSFGAAFARELRDLAAARGRAAHHLWPSAAERKLRDLRLHVVAPEEGLAALGHSAADTRSNQLRALHDLGWEAADRWLARHGGDLGVRGTFALNAAGAD
ncbi:patatin-like phospholipase family protein [Dyella sp. BiH032]|uniref:patatin-like phospholipase family protein n=1 Tax=Dyella sp. BiH032 TaxID=3075430 RepID=UPI002892D26E|nr:patatin-like phospholipase family protein [Dyella sp. BiH032]WNL45619.1 patatin-like phospholipase family protein [Dyella sp. BiH032]